MSNARIASILFGLVAACALIALAWYQAHGDHMILSISSAIAIVVTVLALMRFIPALIRCMSNKVICAVRHDRIR
ncbi:hypothetical protein IM816_15110 [Luteibacter flocculans]|uniref:Uncharacterized protein n=1 Tax=Luteibacter flocculans TaxID=2780091 RepID=A0ABY4T4V3_9GAMM|nr:hypothetical protein [Luteibacter flocculans]URL57924.1 hypothetical protein IM816_15110 [Luteibacter flocculans]